MSTPLNALAPHAPPLLGADGRPLTGTIGEWDAARRPSAPTVAADGAAATPRSSPAVAELPTEFAVASDAVFAATPSRASVSLLGAHRPAVALAATPAELVSQRHWRAAWQAQDAAGANNGARVEGDAAIRAFEMTAGIVATGPTPDSQRQRPADEILAVQRPGASRNWGAGEFAWVAPNSRHNPLYFEDVNLERYGHRFHPVQPLFSAAHFFARIPAMPYLLAAHPSRECVYTLGHDRPGSCAPFEIRRPRWSLAGVVAEAAVATNLIFLLP